MVAGKRTAQLLGAWIVFEDEAGQDLKPAKGRTWSRRGRTPVIKVTGKGSGRVLMAGMICLRPGRETRLIYRTQTYRGRTGEKKGFRAREFAALLTDTHRRLGAPLIVVWGQRQHPPRQGPAGVLRPQQRLAHHRQAPALRARPQSRRRCLGPPEEVPGQPCTPRDRRPHSAREEPATRHPTSARGPRRLYRRDRTGAGAPVTQSPHRFNVRDKYRRVPRQHIVRVRAGRSTPALSLVSEFRPVRGHAWRCRFVRPRCHRLAAAETTAVTPCGRNAPAERRLTPHARNGRDSLSLNRAAPIPASVKKLLAFPSEQDLYL